MDAKPVSESRVEIAQVMMPQQVIFLAEKL
jgi:hypothetical protein